MKNGKNGKAESARLSETVVKELPRRLMTSAMAFYLAARRCDLELEIPPFCAHVLDAPQITSYAFSIELLLKLMIFLRTGRHERGHTLGALFQKLSDSQKLEIGSRIAGGVQTLEEILEEDGDAFTSWRYAHESEFLEICPDTLRNVCEALIEAIEREQPEITTPFKLTRGLCSEV